MADEELKKRLNNSGYKNWLKVSRALIESKEALHDFTEEVIVDVHNDIKSKLGTGECTKTAACNTKKGAPPTCVSCKQWVDEIKKKKCAGMLKWKNANPRIWHNTHWEIAKCFMNDQGNKTNAAANTGPAKTDLSGLLNILVNCKEFKLKHFKDYKLPENVRNIRNQLMHCATMSFTDAEMQGMVDTVIALLEDDKELKHLPICQEKVELIKLLRNSELELKPVEESECIQTALEAHAFAVESGEEINEGMKSLFERLIKLIRGNKDLERKFDDKIKKINKEIEKMRQDSDAKFGKVDITLGELKGQVQSLLKLVNSQGLASTPTTEGSALGHSEMKTFYKNALQSYAQKRKIDLKYTFDKVEDNKFVSTVLVGAEKFKSKEPKQSKKEAEQSAAEEALKALGNEDSEQKNKSVATEQEQAINSGLLKPKDKLNYKNLLQEKAQKKKILKPIYNDPKTDAGFTSEVMYDGNWYSPEMDPQSRKVDAQQKAAQFVLAVLESEEKKPGLCSSNSSLSMPSQGDVDEKEMNYQKNTSKSCRVILYEHVQKVKKGREVPEYKEEKDLDGKFLCKVTVFGEVYESPTSKNSISDAKESAANTACIALQLVEAVPKNSPRAVDLKEEQVSSLEPTSDEVDSAPQKFSTDKETSKGTPTSGTNISPADRPNVKTYKSILNEYAQKHGEKKAEYEEIPGTQFRSKVTVCGETFECVENQPNKKKSKEMAAKEAMKYFDGLSAEHSSKTNYDTSAGFCTKVEPRNVLSGTEAKETTTRKILAKRSEEEPSEEELPAESLDDSLPEIGEYLQNLTIQSKNSEPPGKSDAQQMSIPTQKSPPDFKNALQKYIQKRQLSEDIQYTTKQDPSTKTYVSKVFVGKRCFKGKQLKAKIKEAEKHVAEIALGTLEGRNSKPDDGSEQLLNEYQRDLGFFPAFPNYKETAGNDEYSAEVKVKRKYEIICNDTKPKKKDVEMWLAEQAVKLLEEEKRISSSPENAKSKLNLFLQQSQDGDSKLKYDVKGVQGKFSGDLCFYVVDLYENLVPQPTKEEAIASAAMSACNALDLLGLNDPN